MPYLIQLSATKSEKIHKLQSGIDKLGRQLDNHIVIKDNLISRYHAEIIVDRDRTIIRDLDSRNYTFVNGLQFTEAKLQEGDRLSFGNCNFRYTTVEVPQFSPVVSSSSSPSILKQFPWQQGNGILDKLAKSQPSGKSVVRVYRETPEARAVEKLKLLLEVSQKLCTPQEPQAMLATILELLFKIMDIDRALILLFDETTQELECKTMKLKDSIAKSDSIYSHQIVERVWQTGDALLAADLGRDERFKDARSVIGSGIHASMCVPLKVNEYMLGVLYVDNLSMSLVYSDEFENGNGDDRAKFLNLCSLAN